MHDYIIARGGYGPDPLLLILFFVAATFIGGIILAVGRAASGRKIEPKSKRAANKNAADDFASGLVIVVIVAYVIFVLIKVFAWATDKLL